MKKNKIILKEIDLKDLDSKTDRLDYYDGDIAIIDNISDLTHVAPFYAKMNFIVLCVKGKIQFNINDLPLMLREGEVLLSAPNVILDNYLISVDFACKILCLSDDIIQALLGDHIDTWNLSVYNRHTYVVQLPEEDREQFAYYYELIKFKMEHQNREYRTMVMQSIIKAMLYDVCSMLEEPEEVVPTCASHGKSLFNQFLKKLSNNKIKRQPVEQYASEMNITPKYLSMLCIKYSGKPASDWIAQYTKEDIRYHLCHTDLSVKEISNKLGFTNISFFGSYVRHHFGMSPTKLRNSAVK